MDNNHIRYGADFLSPWAVKNMPSAEKLQLRKSYSLVTKRTDSGIVDNLE